MGRHSFRALTHFIKTFEQEVNLFQWMLAQPRRTFTPDDLTIAINTICGTKRPHGIIKELTSRGYLKNITLPGPKSGLMLKDKGRDFAEEAPAVLARKKGTPRSSQSQPQSKSDASLPPPLKPVPYAFTFIVRAVDEPGATAALVNYLNSGAEVSAGRVVEVEEDAV